MKILITGICGYVGSRLALRLREHLEDADISGVDNFSRRGAHVNIAALERAGIRWTHGDARLPQDLQALPEADWVIDCAANPSVLAGTAAGSATPEQLASHNLIGTLNVLEYCRRHRAGLILLSTSRVYSVDALCRLPLRETPTRFVLEDPLPAAVPGLSEHGIAESFSTEPPLSLYGATKRASEIMALEYAAAFGLPLWIDRCGVIAGPGQFGRADQGILSYWVYAAALDRPLRYIGFGGAGRQVRDFVLAEDIADLVIRQISDPAREAPRIVNVGGGAAGALSLQELTALAAEFLGKPLAVAPTGESRPYDVPFFITDSRAARSCWGWAPTRGAREIVELLCAWTTGNPDVVRQFFP